jgi:hypothetical protein
LRNSLGIDKVKQNSFTILITIKYIKMNFSDWRSLNTEERNAIKWHRRPHIKAATLFGIVIGIFVILFVMRVAKNETSHLNRKPTPEQAYSMAQAFVKDKLKLPASAVFPKNKFDSNIDTAANSYVIGSAVNAQSTDGHFVKQQWTSRLKFTGGDWANKKSWVVEGIDIK